YERLQTPQSTCPTSTPSCSYWASVVTKWMRCRVSRSLDQRAITTCTKSAHPSAHCAHGTSHSSTANVEVFSLTSVSVSAEARSSSPLLWPTKMTRLADVGRARTTSSSSCSSARYRSALVNWSCTTKC